MQFKITFLRGPRVVAEVTGIVALGTANITVQELQQIISTEQLLEKLTGLRVHIDQVP